MLEMQIHFDDRAVQKYLTALEISQIPFATAQALNHTMNQVQTAVRKEAYPKAFQQRNPTLAKAITTIPNKYRATKKNPRVSMMAVQDKRTGRIAGEGFIARQIKGGVKKPKNKDIAIPQIGPGLRRLKTGSIGKSKKPRANPKLFRKGQALYERQRAGKLRLRYILAKRAKASSRGRFRYYETAQATTNRVMQRNWERQMFKAVAITARKYASQGYVPRSLMRQ